MSPITLSGRLLLGSVLTPGRITIEDGRIAAVERTDAGATEEEQLPIIAPGFIDLQVNGGFGYDAADGPDAVAAMAGRLPGTGVTAFLPTIITGSVGSYRRALAGLPDPTRITGARPLGWHLEGPALSPRRPGTHPVQHLASPDSEIVREITSRDGVRLVTLAPELPGALDLVRALLDRGVLVSLGHTDASYEALERGADAGAPMATHLFNAMSPFGHRTPGTIGAVLVDDRLTVGLIADGVHSHPASLELAVRAKGPDRIALITDMVAAAGMPDGRYRLGEVEVELRDGTVRRDDGTLAGAALLMDVAVRNMVRWTSASLSQVLRMASEVPARLLGETDMGRIAAGCRADLVLLDGQLQVQCTMVGGEWAWRREAA